MMEKLLEETFGKLLAVARVFRYPFRFGSLTIHVADGKYAKMVFDITVR